jgi:CMP-N-acetylneuraminic acid synthetase
MTKRRNLMQITALIPMRHHSQRIPGKNYRMLDGKPLFHHILLTLQRCPEITKIAVDTDSTEIMAGLREFFPNVQIIIRPPDLRADIVPMNEILMHDISQAPADLYLQTHSTNPLLRQSTISRSIKTMLEAGLTKDSLFSVTRLQSRLYYANGTAINHDPHILLQTQDLPPVYEENSCIYLFTSGSLRIHKTRIGASPILFETAPEESWDIDEESDFKIVETLIQSQKGGEVSDQLD